MKNAAIWVGVFLLVFLAEIMMHKWFGAPYGGREYNWNKIERKLPNIAILALFITIAFYYADRSDKKDRDE